MLFNFTLSNAKEYTCLLRENSRAKRIILKRNRIGDLVLVHPKAKKIDKDFLINILQKNEEWILKTEKPELAPPTELNFIPLNEVWHIHYLATGLSRISKKIDYENKEISIYSASSIEEIAKIINNFIAKYAEDFLGDRLFYCMKLYGLKLDKEVLKISLARGRWGSYSRKRALSLNARLLFMPLELIDYVIVHELCHTIYLNHSPKFYKLLSEKLPDYKQREKEIKKYDISPFFWL